MNKLDLARHLARQSHRSRGQAADDVDTLVHQLLKELKRPPKPASKDDQSLPVPPSPRPKQ